MIELMPIVKLCFGYAMISIGTAFVVYSLYKMWVERDG